MQLFERFELPGIIYSWELEKFCMVLNWRKDEADN